MKIWIKRIVPFVVIIAIVLGYYLIAEKKSNRIERMADQNALVTAQIWIASAKYRNEPDRFLSFRDSILEEAGLSIDSIMQYLTMFQDEPEKYQLFTERVWKYVDSLRAVEDTLMMEQEKLEKDSLKTDSSVTQ